MKWHLSSRKICFTERVNMTPDFAFAWDDDMVYEFAKIYFTEDDDVALDFMESLLHGG